MSQQITSRRENIAFNVAGYAMLAAVAVFVLPLAPSATIRWIEGILLLTSAILQARMPKVGSSPGWRFHLYLALQGSLVAGLLFLHPGMAVSALLYFPLSVQAVLMVSTRPGFLWIGVFTLTTAASFVSDLGWRDSLPPLLIYGGGFFFFGTYANALIRADAARRESQALLNELQETHRQLQEYAARIEELVIVEERNRLAREMHDTLGHRLTVAAVQLEGAQRLIPQDPEKAAGMVGTVREQVREALSELRNTVTTLRTPIEADLRLCGSLKRLATHFEQATGLTVHQVLPEERPDLPGTHRLALYRAAQEALTNVQKHAEASQVWLVLNVHDEAVTLLVSDDGRGVSLSADQVAFGLRGLRERAEQLGGELHLEPRPGGGTQLSFRLPLPGEETNG
jgi:signal transduction histidine kinase